ncbi:MAG: sulfite exporter TauE/SafE family protein, partial [Methyloceanibacter sp.]
LAAGGVVGGQFGVRAGQKLKGEQLRLLLALLVLGVAFRLLLDLVMKPDDVYSIVPLLAGS